MLSANSSWFSFVENSHFVRLKQMPYQRIQLRFLSMYHAVNTFQREPTPKWEGQPYWPFGTPAAKIVCTLMKRLVFGFYCAVMASVAVADVNNGDPQRTGDNRMDNGAQATHLSNGETSQVAPQSAPNSTPNLDAPSPINPPMLPGPAPLSPQISTYSILPKTLRQGFAYRDAAKTEITLTQPAKHEMIYQVVSTLPDQVECGKIVFEKGDIKRTGTVHVKWENVTGDCCVPLKIYSSLNSATVLYLRLYLHPEDVSQ